MMGIGGVVGSVSTFIAAHRGVAIGALTLLVLFVVYKLITRGLRLYLRKAAYREENVQNFLWMWRYLWLGAGFVLVVISLSGSLTSLGISAAFLGMILGWSLQAPVTGIAAWLMIVVKRPFKIGDRVIISGITGDVRDITLTHVVLNQVGGTVAGEEKSGRGVLIPNATLFQQIIYNYAMESAYVLDEVPVLITYDSDVDLAEEILVRCAREVTQQIMEATDSEPFIRRELAESGIRLRLRYQAAAMDRQRLTSQIIQGILRAFNREPRVEFCYPHTEIVYRPKDAGSADSPSTRQQPADEDDA